MEYTHTPESGSSSSAFSRGFSSSSRSQQRRSYGMDAPGQNQPPQPPSGSGDFEIFEWYPSFQKCHRYFLDHAQHSEPVQAVCAFINIALPFQKEPLPIVSSSSSTLSPHPSHSGSASGFPRPPPSRTSSSHARTSTIGERSQVGGSSFISLTPYLRRLIATGFDTAPILHGFFGDTWVDGVGPIHEVERRNYLFAAKSANWLIVKKGYDLEDNQTVPFLRPLRQATEKEIKGAEEGWSEWLAMQDWMIGERGLDVQSREGSLGAGPGFGIYSRQRDADRMNEEGDVRIKTEPA